MLITMTVNGETRHTEIGRKARGVTDDEWQALVDEAREQRAQLEAAFERDNAGVPWYNRVPGGPPKAKDGAKAA